MKWDSFIRLVADLPLFDLATAVQMAGKDRPRIRVQLHRWSKAGRVIRLRRGLYALAEPYRKARLSALRIANEVYQPSYLSRLWALSHYGLVPEAVPVYQSATTRVTRRFDNAFGSFAYSSLKQDFFWGFTTKEIDGVPVAIARPEKALLDLWHLAPGEWTAKRLAAMRFQQLDLIDPARLAAFVDRWRAPRICRAARRFGVLIQSEGAFEAIA